MNRISTVLLALALFAPAAHGQPDSLAARRDTIVPGAARLAAAKTIPELLAARVPGLQVRPGSGAVAAGSRLRLRGAAGISLHGEPLLVVDGVRVVSESNDLATRATGQRPSRVDDFLADDVERVEVLSGPAAIARYGPEGANGVVEVYTRRGTPGGPRFRAFAEAGSRTDVTAYPANYARVGRLADGRRTTRCTLTLQSAGGCTPVGDSLLSFNPLEEASPFRTGGTQRVGGSVAGSAGPLTYLAGGAAERDLGVLRRDSRRRAEARGSFTLRPGRGVVVAGSALHLRTELELPNEDEALFGTLFNGLTGFATDDPVRRGYGRLTQKQRDTLGVTQNGRRTLAVASVRWTVLPWLAVGGQYGIDDVAADEVNHFFNTGTSFQPGSHTGETAHTRRNADLFARAEYALGPTLLLSTTAGGERWSRRMHTLGSFVSDRGSSTETLTIKDAATALFVRQGVAWRGRVAGSLALRRDDPLAGTDALLSAALSAAWDVGGERFFPRPGWVDGLRLRAAYGRAERDPAKLPFVPLFADVCTVCPATDTLVPQRQTELEGGVDVALLGGRVDLSVTGYGRRTDDVFTLLASNSGARLVNSGRVVNRGAEARLRVGSPAVAPLFWELVGIGAVNRNRLEDYESPPVNLARTGQAIRDGHPVGGFYGPRITGFQDRDGDGIIGRAGCFGSDRSACEVQLGDAEYLGPADPTGMLGVHGRVRVGGVELSALLDHQGGMRRANVTDRLRCVGAPSEPACQAAFDPRTPLAEQARVVAYGTGTGFLLVEDGSFTRIREAAVTLAVPERWARRFGGRGMELTLAGRNLATWTPYGGLDPETSYTGQSPVAFGESFTQPLPRTLTTRLDVRF